MAARSCCSCRTCARSSCSFCALRAEFDLPDAADADADADAAWMPPAEVLAALGGDDGRSIVDIGTDGDADGDAPVSFQA